MEVQRLVTFAGLFKEKMTGSSWVPYGILIGLFIALQIGLHINASYNFPTPWPDETHFLWQAVAFQDTGSLYSAELHLERSIFWMPPGYFIFMGTVFKIFGASLGIARTTSLVLMIAAFLLLLMISYDSRFKYPVLILCGLTFAGSNMVATANVGRMEALLITAVLGGLMLIRSGHVWKALALLVVTPLVHPNGLFYIVAVGIFLGLDGEVRRGLRRPSIGDWTLISLAALSWLIYGLYIAANWSWFFHDMSFQFTRKSNRDLFGIFLTTENVLAFLGLIVCLAYAAKERLRLGPLAIVGLTSWFIVTYGREMWYEVFRELALLCFAIILLRAGFHLIEHLGPNKLRATRHAALVGVAILALFVSTHKELIMDFRPIQTRSDRWAMGARDGVPYITEADTEEVRNFLYSLEPQGRPLWIQFQPRADGFFFRDLDSARFRISQPTFEDRGSDIYIVHFSRNLPPWWRFTHKEMGLLKIDPESNKDLLLARDSTEKWYYRLSFAE